MKRILFNQHITPTNFTGFCLDTYSTMEWYLGGKCHRIDGPAREWAAGDYDWYLNGVYYSFEEDYFEELKKL